MKSRFLKNRLLSITLLLALAVALACAFSAIGRGFNNRASAEAGSTETAIATVEGQEILSKIYRMYLKNGIEVMGLSEKTDEGRRRIEQLKEGIVSDLVDRALIEAEARRRGLVIPDEMFKASYDKRVAEMGGDEAYQEYLKQSAVTDEDFRHIIRQEIYGELLRKDFEKTISVSSAESKAFYDKEKSNEKFKPIFIDPEQVRASHILIAARRSIIASEIGDKGITDKAKLDRAISEEIARRRARATDILSKVKAGADFARLARESSDDAGTSERGGNLGLFPRNTHTARFDEAAFSIKAGQTSGIIETDYGFHIIKVTEHRLERTRTLAEVRPVIEQHLVARKLAEQLASWLAERRRAADVKIAPAYRNGHKDRTED